MAAWVGREILPHERDLRGWLRSRLFAADDIEDIVQECYCQIARLNDVSHIAVPRAYLFTVARHLVHRQRQQARVVRLEPIGEDAGHEVDSDLPSPERSVAARQELDRVRAAVATLSDRAQRIFVLRRVEGMSQKAIAQLLGVSEAVVENDASRSLRAILKMLGGADADPPTVRTERSHVRAR